MGAWMIYVCIGADSLLQFAEYIDEWYDVIMLYILYPMGTFNV